MNNKTKVGQLKVWHIPQILGKAFEVLVDSVEEGEKFIKILADYDAFQFKENIKPDYSNASGLSRYEGKGKTKEWCTWYDKKQE